MADCGAVVGSTQTAHVNKEFELDLLSLQNFEKNRKRHKHTNPDSAVSSEIGKFEGLIEQLKDGSGFDASDGGSSRSSSPTQPPAADVAWRSPAPRSRDRCTARWFGRGIKNVCGPPGLNVIQSGADIVSQPHEVTKKEPRGNFDVELFEEVDDEYYAHEAQEIRLDAGANAQNDNMEHMDNVMETQFTDVYGAECTESNRLATVVHINDRVTESEDQKSGEVATATDALLVLESFCRGPRAAEWPMLVGAEDYMVKREEELACLTEKIQAHLSDEDVCARLCETWEMLGELVDGDLPETCKAQSITRSLGKLGGTSDGTFEHVEMADPLQTGYTRFGLMGKYHNRKEPRKENFLSMKDLSRLAGAISEMVMTVMLHLQFATVEMCELGNIIK